MILFNIICITLGVGGLVFGIIREYKCIKKDKETEAWNYQLAQQNQQLVETNQQLSESFEENLKKEKILITELNELTHEQAKYQIEINFQEKKREELEAQLGSLNRSIESLTGGQKEAMRAALESYFETLDIQYIQKEREFDEEIAYLDKLYESRQDTFLQQLADNERELNQRREECERDLVLVRSELDKIKSSRAAAIEAQLREQEIKDQATLYTLQLNEADRRDVAYLKSIEFNLREARPLRMLIWSTFYRDKLNDLAARVGAVGACGIYKITHIDSGISYIGQAKDIKERWVKEVKESLGIDAPTTNQRCNFMREKGVDNFTFEVLEKCSITDLNEKEKFYIDLYQTYDFGLNGNKGIGK